MRKLIIKKLIWKTEKRKISDLIPYKKNPRKLSDTQYEQLKKSLDKYNLAEIPVIDLDNTVLAGNQRLKIMKELYGNIEIDVRIPNRKLTDTEIKEYNIRSNRNHGEWDFDILKEEFDRNILIDFGFTYDELFGFKEEDFEEASEDEQGDLEILDRKHKKCPKCGYEF